MRLLLTRAVEDAARTTARLEALGHIVLVSPVIEIVPISVYWPSRPPTGVIATSAHAFCGDRGDEPSRQVKETVPLFLVGKRTEEAARRQGFSGPATVARDSATLAPILIAQKRTRFVYLAGRDRKDAIEDKLGAAGHRPCVLETYRAEAATALTPDAVAALGSGSIDGVLHYSRRSAEIVFTLAVAAGLDPARFKHLCLSRDVATAVYERGGTDALVASVPEEQAMLTLLDQA